MKRLLLILFFAVVALSPSFAQYTLEEDNPSKETFAESTKKANSFVSSIKRYTPYHNDTYHLTLKSASVNKENYFIKLNITIDSGYEIPYDKDFYLSFLGTNAHWNIQSLLNYVYDIRIHAGSAGSVDPLKGSAGCSVVLTRDNMIEYYTTPQTTLAQKRLKEYVESVQSDLPMVTGEGETFSACRYDDEKAAITFVLEYQDTLWPTISTWLNENYEELREHRAQELLASNENFVDYVKLGMVTLRHVYRNTAKTDSIELSIAPWMWEHLTPQTATTEADTLEQIRLSMEEQNQQCPVVIDSITTMRSCSFDTTTRVITFTYELTELAMASISSNTTVMQNLKTSITRYLQQNVEYVELLSRLGCTLVFTYSSPHGGTPLTFLFSTEDLKQLMGR